RWRRLGWHASGSSLLLEGWFGGLVLEFTLGLCSGPFRDGLVDRLFSDRLSREGLLGERLVGDGVVEQVIAAARQYERLFRRASGDARRRARGGAGRAGRAREQQSGEQHDELDRRDHAARAGVGVAQAGALGGFSLESPE